MKITLINGKVHFAKWSFAVADPNDMSIIILLGAYGQIDDEFIALSDEAGDEIEALLTGKGIPFTRKEVAFAQATKDKVADRTFISRSEAIRYIMNELPPTTEDRLKMVEQSVLDILLG